MTVKELILELMEFDMESDVEIVGHSNPHDYETFTDFNVDEEYEYTGKNTILISFDTDGLVFVEEDRLEELEELEEEHNG